MKRKFIKANVFGLVKSLKSPYLVAFWEFQVHLQNKCVDWLLIDCVYSWKQGMQFLFKKMKPFCYKTLAGLFLHCYIIY